ncbi:MerR family transcriptional regulator [Streptococcus entericus]|uniref:MerR family transcriptional regulator n=1 Tax=Streptococcus entericus TaxID=155680 RepID=UPI0003658B26|nr:MerR family transcriptional regulator [Streptococcus entericus]
MNIKAVSEKTGLSPDTIRYYEKISLLPPIARNKAGVRVFSEQDVSAIEFVRCFRATGMSIEQLSAYMTLVQAGDETMAERLAILRSEQARLEASKAVIEESLQRLEEKITHYEQLNSTEYEAFSHEKTDTD